MVKKDGAYEKIIMCFLGFACILVLLLGIWSVISTRYMVKYRLELGQYRAELANATDRESVIAESVGRTGEILGRTVNTVAELRIQLAEVRKEYESMEVLLYGERGSGCNDDCDSVDKEIKDEK